MLGRAIKSSSSCMITCPCACCHVMCTEECLYHIWYEGSSHYNSLVWGLSQLLFMLPTRSLPVSQPYFRVLIRPFPKGTVPFGVPNVPFGSAQKPIMCPLAPPQNQDVFNSHLNYLNLKTVWALNIELSKD